MPTRDVPTAREDRMRAYGAEERARKLRLSVERSSSEGARIAQTLNHLKGKEEGEAADYAIRKHENLKEEEAEDLEKRAEIMHKSASDKINSRGIYTGEIGKKWKDSFI